MKIISLGFLDRFFKPTTPLRGLVDELREEVRLLRAENQRLRNLDAGDKAKIAAAEWSAKQYAGFVKTTDAKLVKAKKEIERKEQVIQDLFKQRRKAWSKTKRR